MYDAETSGNLIWQELIFVDFNNGYYTTQIGANPTNPIDIAKLSTYPLFLEIEVDNTGPLTPRQELNATPYATLSAQAESIDGGPVNTTQISVGGALIIDQNGSWVGPTMSVSWSNVTGIPGDLLDGDDDTLATLSCAPGEIVSWSGRLGIVLLTMVYQKLRLNTLFQ